MSELPARSLAQVLRVIMFNNLTDLPAGGEKKLVLYAQYITTKTISGRFSISHEVKTKQELHYVITTYHFFLETI
jgi:hypothetical protein